jgi:hypothetical protein
MDARINIITLAVADQARDRPRGICSGYFRDPDGHLCEVIWNANMPSQT